MKKDCLFSTDQNSDLEELPVNGHIFEGHLYLKRYDGKWTWKLFRFDGSSLICLSTKKIKIQPNVTLGSHQNNSATSLLLATPKDKSSRLLTATDLCKEPSYYQLPKWTLNVCDISSIAILKRSNYKHAFFKSKSNSFCIRSSDGQCYVMKARTLDELERWVFVLSKMWKLSQLLPSSSSSSSCNPPLRKASVPQGTFNHSSVIIPPATTTPPNTTQCKPVRKAFLTAEKISFIENWLSSVNEQVYQSDDCENGLQKGSKSFTHKHLSCIEEMPNPNKLLFNFFQDANTVYTDESETHSKKYTYSSLKYHGSTRACHVKLIKSDSTPSIPSKTRIVHSLPTVFMHSPLELLKSATSFERHIKNDGSKHLTEMLGNIRLNQ
ncbi:uncharacterized protein RHIMIDRAFT_99269 [Rhizopus microsporus ATCC 52813]|uniref:PH domain-containing protein n=2 Tax=Rhizopus microsporus TaxID=58291 RepID=A0A2G4SGC4_RHIZD|nr:uncharacterized protein RHIMIDRAFT_99269 [Rhizopus microsporus ATCC 52813]PHZ07446.1 hypothetical protein RHIMIDRAFT_99269 [Rhizopus microsporus ATCC 52813]